MSRADKDVAATRHSRRTARGIFERDLARVKNDLEARGPMGRVADSLRQEAREMGEEALEVAKESKGIIAGTIAALGLWLLRKPIIGWIARRREKD